MGNFLWLPHLILLLLLVPGVVCSSSHNPNTLCVSDDKSALLQFKSTMSIGYEHPFCGDSYPKTKLWNESTNCCSWEGVTCDVATGRVIGLDLGCSMISGSFPQNTSLSRLKGLKQLNLAFNDFNGSEIPHGFSQLVSLEYLNLSHSSLSGLVPSDVSILTKLTSIDLSRNFWKISFDSHNFEMLTRNLSKLENLFLDHVNMSAVVPTSFKNLPPSLKGLSLYECRLQGEFPSEIFQLGNLEYLDLSSNSLTGHLPKSNWSIPLRLLDLSDNQFRGSVPASLGNLTRITSLDFSSNLFEGQIPDVFGNLNKLTTMYFSSCSFSGQLPPSLFNLTQLTSLGLSSNGLEESLDLSHNSLTGPINEIKNPNSIRFVHLDDNDIHGEIPTSFFGLVKLIHLDLSSNNLSWVIQSDMLSKLESLESLHLSSNNLSGVAKLDVLSLLKNLSDIDLSNNKLLSVSSDTGVISTFQALWSLDLSSCNVRQFPNFLRSVKSLKQLDLSNNVIRGSILNWESKGWEQLVYLNLSHNFLTTIEQFPGKNLQTLDLRSNLLRSSLPDTPASLDEFLISENKLAGEIPPSICNLTSLRILDLSMNYFGGVIPTCLGNFSNRVSVINLQSNNLRGKIPNFCVDYDNHLTNLALNDNQLEGLLPQSLVNCTSLRFLNLANNTLNGLFPHQLSILPDLQVLILRSNGFYGGLDAASGFLSLQVIDLSQNDFTGPLPTKFFQSFRAMKVVVYYQNEQCSIYTRVCGDDNYNIKNVVEITMKRLEMELDLEKSLTGFTLIDFSDNRFDGQIPKVLGELHSLLVLNLSHNSLTGPLPPPSMGNMAALESLDLSSNKLGGRIPSEWMKLTFLEVLNLSQNNLVGPIPVGNQFNTFDNDSYAGNLDLCGFPLSKKCGNEEEPKPPTSKLVEDDGSAIPFIWKLVIMGYGCGVVLGLSTGYIVFTTRRPWWFVRMVERDWQRNFTRWIRRIQGKRNMH
ncbi:hypothetical protein V6N11_038492 [Hibiscus sabdariffa]|uniref:Leucine-rich repeat-containing N-terminal plant-type domain-containing protein n=1 Tax=Hibiscus sabdariffa TaxID=183260 RepID=A0ABR2SK72_9ROSI